MAGWPFDVADPWAGYRAAREREPVQEIDGDVFVLSRAAITAALRDPALTADPRCDPRLVAELGDEGTAALARTVLFADGADHARLRDPVRRWFTPRAVAALADRIAAVVDAALVPLHDGEPVELMRDVAATIPLAVVAELFDIGVEGAELLRAETPGLTRILEAAPTAADREASVTASLNLTFFLVPLVAARAREPGGDLLSALAASGLATDEVVAMALLLVAAGHETTANLLGNGALALLQHDVTRVAGDPTEELLRYDSPVQVTRRAARRDTSLGGVAIPAGTRVNLMLGAANRETGDTLRLDDPRPTHLAFGHGAHFCLGAGLARLEGAVAFARLAPLLRGTWSATRADTGTFRRVGRLALAPSGAPAPSL